MVLRVIIEGFALICGSLVAFSFLGHWFAASDSFAVVRLPLAALLFIGALFVTQGWPRKAALSVAFFSAISIFWHFLPLASKGEVIVYQKNMYFGNANVLRAAEDIAKSNAMVAFLQEVPRRHEVILQPELSKTFPFWHWCSFTGVGGTAIASRWPMIEGTEKCPLVRGLSMVQAKGPAGPVWLVSLHMHWPWPFGQAAQLEQVLEELKDLDGPVILAGDFNMVPWSSALSRVAKASGTQRAGGVKPTLHKEGIPFPIDHVLSPKGGQIEIRPRLGSDHSGVIAYVTLD